MTPVTEPARRTPIDGWADAWDTHGPSVLCAAAALDMDVAEALRRIVGAMADPTAPFDPLEAMMAALVEGHRRSDRRRAREALLAAGVPSHTTRSLTARARTRSAAKPRSTEWSAFDRFVDLDTRTPRTPRETREPRDSLDAAPTVAFSALRQLAADLPPVPIGDHSPGTDPACTERRTRAPATAVRATAIAVAVITVVAVAVAGTLLIVRRPTLSPARFGPLTPTSFNGWNVIRSEANVAVPTNRYDTLVQEFGNDSGTRLLHLETTPRYVRAFADEALGDIGDPSIESAIPLASTVRHLERRDVAIDTFTVDVSASVTRRGSWVTTDAAVRFTAVGFSEATLLAVLDELVQRDPSGQRGFDLGEAIGGLAVRRESRTSRPSAVIRTQWIVLGDTNGGTVGIRVLRPDRPELPALLVTRPDGTADGAGANGGAGMEQIELRPGVIAEHLSGGGRIEWYRWTERGATVDVSAYNGTDPDLPARVESLVRGFGPIDEASWEVFDRAADHRVSAAEVTDRVTVGPLQLTFHAAQPGDPLSRGVCASGACAVWRTPDNIDDPYTADLLIDGHWWHLEHFGALAERTTNRWLTSPGGRPPLEFELEGQLLTTWRATDFGTTVQAARTARQEGVLTRPVAAAPE